TASTTPRPAPAGYELVLDRERWDSLNAFAQRSGFDLVLPSTAGPGPGSGGRWDSHNAESLIEYTRDAGYRVPVWELGNEVDAYWFTHGLSSRVSGKQYVSDLARFADRVHAVFPGVNV